MNWFFISLISLSSTAAINLACIKQLKEEVVPINCFGTTLPMAVLNQKCRKASQKILATAENIPLPANVSKDCTEHIIRSISNLRTMLFEINPEQAIEAHELLLGWRRQNSLLFQNDIKHRINTKQLWLKKRVKKTIASSNALDRG